MPEETAPKNAVLNVDLALDRLSGDRELFMELGQIFLSEYSAMVTSVREAIDAGDAEQVSARRPQP